MYFDEKRNEVIETYINPNPDLDRKVVILDSEQVEAIKVVINQYQEEIKKAKTEIHKLNSPQRLEVNQLGRPRVYIAEYITHDDYGPLRETDVFSKEEDAWAFVLKQRDEGATDISVKPRLVYLDKDRTVNFND